MKLLNSLYLIIQWSHAFGHAADDLRRTAETSDVTDREARERVAPLESKI